MKIYASSSGFIKGRLVYTAYDSACLRSILIKSKGYRTDIDPKYQVLGAKNEERFEQKLKDAGRAYERETSVSGPVDGVPEVIFSGRRDFVVAGNGAPEIIEIKATSSKSKYQMLRENRYVVENLAQTVAYMVQAEAIQGRLIYSYYKNPTDVSPHLEREYVVTITDAGDILVNGAHSSFTVADYLLHRYRAADAVKNDTVYERPHNYNATFGSPCTYCPFKSACDKYDTGFEPDLLSAVSKLGLTKRDK